MRIGIMTCCVLLGAGGVIPASSGGPNEGGVLVVHCNGALTYTQADEYCGRSGLTHCSEADVRVDPSAPVILHVLAAFPDSSSPRMLAVDFGIDYDPTVISILDSRGCGAYEVPDDDWPGPETGIAVIWGEAQTAPLTEVCWFAAYNYSQAPATLATIDPGVGGFFVDDGNPGDMDPIAGYGRMGFFTEGYNPCDWLNPTPSVEHSWGSIKANSRK